MTMMVKRAGDVTGTPAWQKERMFPEELNNETDYADSSARIATQCMNDALEWIGTTFERLNGTEDAEKVATIYDWLSDLRFEFEKIRKGWTK